MVRRDANLLLLSFRVSSCSRLLLSKVVSPFPLRFSSSRDLRVLLLNVEIFDPEASSVIKVEMFCYWNANNPVFLSSSCVKDPNVLFWANRALRSGLSLSCRIFRFLNVLLLNCVNSLLLIESSVKVLETYPENLEIKLKFRLTIWMVSKYVGWASNSLRSL